MSYIRLVNQRRGFPSALPGELQIAADRTNPVLGNPFSFEVDTPSSRLQVIRQFSAKVERALLKDSKLKEAVDEIARTVSSGIPVALLCWCHPKPCHAQVIREAVSAKLGIDLTPPDELPEEDFQGQLF